jgi:F-type H+-transporting ATPase subunit b
MKRLVLIACLALGVVLLFAPRAQAQHGEAPSTPPTTEHAQPDAGHAAGEEHAAGAHEKGELIPPFKQGLPAMIAAYIVFAVVVVVLGKKAWPPIAKGLNDRSDKIRQEIEAAEQARQQAKDALEQYERSLAEARAEAKKMLEDAKAQQQALAADLRAKADVELTAMKDRARRDIDAAKRAAIDEIYTQGASLASIMAGKILRRSLTPQDNQRLMEESLGELQAMKN